MSVHKKVPVPLENGVTATFVTFDFATPEKEHIALLFPGWDSSPVPLVRIHSECLTGDVFASMRCDCHAQLHEAIDTMTKDGGIILYLRQEGRGIGLKAKLDAYDLQIRDDLDTYEANLALGKPEDMRDYSVAAQMLKDLDIPKVRLLTNNLDKANSLRANEIEVSEIQRTTVHKTSANHDYLDAKLRHGHLLTGT